MHISSILAILLAACVYADHRSDTNTITYSTIECRTGYGPSRISSVPKSISRTETRTSSTTYVYANSTTATVKYGATFTFHTTTTTTQTQTQPPYTSVVRTTKTITTPVLKCPLPSRSATAEIAKRGNVNAEVSEFPTNIICYQTVTYLTVTTSSTGQPATVTITSDVVTVQTDTITNYETKRATATVTITYTATATLGPVSCGPPRNASCSPARRCADGFDLYTCGSGYGGGPGTYSCDCGIDSLGLATCFTGVSCNTTCTYDSDCPAGSGCQYYSCCGTPVCAQYDTCGVKQGGPARQGAASGLGESSTG